MNKEVQKYGINFEWDSNKDEANQAKHHIAFIDALDVFVDPNLIIEKYTKNNESRAYAYGRIGNKILTVRFTVKNNGIRIIGAGFWRKGRKKYEQQ